VDQGTHAELITRSAGYQNLVTAYERAESERTERAGRAGRAATTAEPIDAGEEAMAQ
jgi:hypothetical protein